MNSTLMGLVAITLVTPTLMAGDGDLASWQNLQRLSAGQAIDVRKANGESLRGTFVSFDDQSISLRGEQQEIAVRRSDVSRVRLRSPRSRRYSWIIGAAVGAGAGLGVGAGIGESLANRSGGDFRNLKPAIMGVSAGAFALVGAVIGSAIGSRHTTIYSAK